MKSRKAGLQCQNSSVTEAEADRFEAFVEDLRRRGRADKTVESYRSDWVGLRNWYGGRQGEPFELSAVDA
ncbi:MAG: hypothetical protein GY812_14210, partial [Actinomycetia bacterium]|nr:hypothetical protein [Actinomycetes bacterium]